MGNSFQDYSFIQDFEALSIERVERRFEYFMKTSCFFSYIDVGLVER